MKERVAIVGSGIAGLGCAWNLKDACALTLFEQEARPGGHTNTVTINENGRSVPVDTGFIVFNKVTYPNLCRLFAELNVPVKPSEMSFSVQHLPSGLEYNGMGLNKVFAQRANLFRPRFHAFLRKIPQFFRLANALAQSPEIETLTIREFVEAHGFGEDFLRWYLVPMSSAIWSTDPGEVLNFPMSTLIRFFHNHGFLGVRTHHQWFTVDGGAKTYVERILAQLGAPRLAEKIVRVEELPRTAVLTTEKGRRLEFERVVLASHADQSLRLLAAPDAEQQRLLAPFRYQRNHATLHTDESVMPKRRLAWASWNYRVESGAGRAHTHYWMNALQNVSPRQNYFVSLNVEGRIPREKILYETVYEHPVYTRETAAAQRELPGLNARAHDQRVFFCGSYFRYGFHEDAYASAVNLAALLREKLAA